MSSSNSSSNYGSDHSTILSQSTFRSQKSQDHRGERTERQTSHGKRVVTYEHHAKGYDQYAPTPSYGQSTTYGRQQ
ncbi:hypothetical protein F5B22DRAFT_125716 [Xylaria bambusicola]|uniref:uncharacterized protein n=1 Tax=Xylaria bambusicola TaxID=326684 RepID=UPI002007EB29|nr:uncharacterized protein F5B22DRAFT_125716 [Xylaria bambusicola]KAI0517078.1 hypothetical protein F5B22DRAFT_125716 [Xylaria bambusicola]